jgi:hypothetical protein
MPQIRTHRRGQRQVLGRCAVISGPGQGQTQPELGVVVARAGIDDPLETAGRRSVALRVELRPPERLEDAARVGLGGGSALEQLRRSRRAAPLEQVEAAPVKGVYVFLPGPRRVGRARLFAGTGIPTA